MKRFILFLGIVFLSARAVSSKDITVPVFPEEGYVLSARGASITFFKDPDTESPHLMEAYESIYNRDTKPTEWLWSNQTPPQGFKFERAHDGFVYIPMEKQGQWVKVWHIDRPVWVSTGGAVSLQTTPLIAPEESSDAACYIVQPVWADQNFYVRERKEGKFSGMCAFYYEWGGMQGLFIGCKINDMIVFPAFIPCSMDYFFASGNEKTEVRISKAKSGRFYFISYPINLAFNYKLDINKITDEQVADLLKIANFSDDLMIVYRSYRARNSPDPMIWFKPGLWTGETMTVPFQAATYPVTSYKVDDAPAVQDVTNNYSDYEEVIYYPEGTEPVDPDRIYDKVDTEASFPGGKKGLDEWMRWNKKYPTGWNSTKTQRVDVQFVVTSTGEIRDVKVVENAPLALSQIAVKMVKKMPAWTPAEVRGIPVGSVCRLSIYFRERKYVLDRDILP